MGIVKKSGKYFIDYRVNGKRFRKIAGKSKRIAELALKNIEVKIAKNEFGFEQKDSDLYSLFNEFLTYSKTNHSSSTQNRYRAILDNFKRFLKGHLYLTKLSQLTIKTFEDYKAYRKNDGAANKTINIELGCLRLMSNLAIKWGYAKENPVKGISMLKEDNQKKPRFLSKDEFRLLLENCGDTLYPIFYTFLNTGMRKSELEHLEWKDIDFTLRKIKIGIKVNWRPKTTEREIPINDSLLDILIKHKTTRNGQLVFHRGEGQPIEPNSLRKKLMAITKQCGFPDVTKLHSLIHTFASYLVMNGVELPTVKKLMGHSNIDTIMIYSHLADEHVDRAVEKLSF